MPRTFSDSERGLSPKERALRGRVGAHRLHATHDPRETTAKSRETFLSRFEIEVDPDGILCPEERLRRAEHAKKAYFARLALASARARRKLDQELSPTDSH